MTIASGSFSRDFQVLVRDQEETDLTRQASKYCLEADSVQIAVLEGVFDDIEGILDDLSLDYTVEGNDGGGVDPFFGFPNDQAGLDRSRNFLLNPMSMAQYDIIFINCGLLWDLLKRDNPGDLDTIINNLRTYYMNGGSIYASDWAFMFIEQPFPNVLDFLPASGATDTESGARQGYAPQVINASVDSPELQMLLGQNTVAIDFPQDPANGVVNTQWVMVAGADAATTVHLSGAAQQCASADNCSSAGATLQNSPLLITYKNTVSDGSMAFTAFHNHAEGTPISPEISQILKFLIFQL